MPSWHSWAAAVTGRRPCRALGVLWSELSLSDLLVETLDPPGNVLCVAAHGIHACDPLRLPSGAVRFCIRIGRDGPLIEPLERRVTLRHPTEQLDHDDTAEHLDVGCGSDHVLNCDEVEVSHVRRLPHSTRRGSRPAGFRHRLARVGAEGLGRARAARVLPIQELLGSRPVDALLHEGEAQAVADRGGASFATTFVRVLPMEIGKGSNGGA